MCVPLSLAWGSINAKSYKYPSKNYYPFSVQCTLKGSYRVFKAPLYKQAQLKRPIEVFYNRTFICFDLCGSVFVKSQVSMLNLSVSPELRNLHIGTIILGDGGHRSTGYVTSASAVQLFSKLCKLFDLMTSRWPIKPCKIQDFSKEGTVDWSTQGQMPK